MSQSGGLLSGWRGLARFWAAVLALAVAGIVVLQTLGPPPIFPVTEPIKPPTGPAARTDAVSAAPVPSQSKTTDGKAADAKPMDTSQQADLPLRPGRMTPGPIADPDPAMLEPAAGASQALLPRISIDGRAPMSAYAAGFDASTLRPRVGILIAGIGMSEADSMAAIKALPGGVTLAISPYADDIGRLLAAARSNEHEYLLSVPMEPQGYPANDPDDRSALMTSLPPAENLSRLQAILTRLTGYAGVTNALGPLHGERLASVATQLDPVLQEIARRGLLFVDVRTGQKVLPHVWNRSADMVLDDDPLDAAVLDQRLDVLTHLALDKGSALGIVSVPRPVTVERIAAWTNTLASKGLALAPVSALVLPPAKQEPGK
jgi:hypothetical protein